MNMAKKQNSFSSTKRDRNGENVPAIRNWNTGLRRKTLLQNASQE